MNPFPTAINFRLSEDEYDVGKNKVNWAKKYELDGWVSG